MNNETVIDRLNRIFQLQRKAFLKETYPNAQRRIDLLKRIPPMMKRNRQRILDALEADFGGHARELGDLVEILNVMGRAQYNIENLQAWMEPVQKAADPVMLGGGRAWVEAQPKGVIGNMVSWNFPFDIGMGPTMDALAAGNRVIIKPSDLVPVCGSLLPEMVSQTFDESEVAVVNGDLDLARHFPTLPWDHLIYTGSTSIGKEVMKAAASNLVPVTLELGGKCPAVVDEEKVQDELTIGTIAGVKALKRGQMCVSVDYCLVPASGLGAFIETLTKFLQAHFTDNSATGHMCGIISERHQLRLQQLVEDARSAGAQVIQIGEACAGLRTMPFHVIVNPPRNSAVMQEEVFGPILPVIAYESTEQAIEFVQAGERPLGIYVFSDNQTFIDRFARGTLSGGFAINSAATQASLPSMGFGGVGASGMGRHHGHQGFLEFSNPRGYFQRGEGGLMEWLAPPFSDTSRTIIEQAYAAFPEED